MVDSYTFEHNFEFVIFSGLLKKTGVDKGKPLIPLSSIFVSGVRSSLDDRKQGRPVMLFYFKISSKFALTKVLSVILIFNQY